MKYMTLGMGISISNKREKAIDEKKVQKKKRHN